MLNQIYDGFQSLDLWVILLALLTFLPVCIFLGFKVARFHAGKAGYDIADTIPASILGVHALLIGFTFSMSISRYEVRRELVIKEANAIGTAYLRSKTLRSPHDSEAKDLYLEYLKNKVEFGKLTYHNKAIPEVLRNIGENQSRLWAHAQAMVKDNRSPIEALYLNSLNEVIDVHSEMMGALHNPLPFTVLGLLLVTLAIAMMSYGYVEGLKSHKSGLWLAILAILFSVVLTLIIDLDRARRGWIVVSQAPMTELYESVLKETGTTAH